MVFCWASCIAGLGGALVDVGVLRGLSPDAPGVDNSDLFLRLAAGIGMLALSFRPRLLADERRCRLAVIALAMASWVMNWASALFGSLGFVPLVLGNLAAGFALGLFVPLWLGGFREEFSILLVMLLMAACLEQTVYLGVLRFGFVGMCVSTALLPMCAVAVMARPRRKMGVRADDAPALARGRSGWSYWAFAGALLLCNFASGPISYGTFGGGANANMTAFLTLALAVVFMLCPRLGDEAVLALFALLVGACTAPLLILSDLPVWFDGLPNAAFWAFNMYSVAWFTMAGGRGENGVLSPKSLRGMAAVYLMTVLAEALGVLMPSQVTNVVAVSCVGVALVVALVNAARPSSVPAASVPGGGEVMPVVDSFGVATFEALGERASLTDGERGVLEWLARGYTLKQAARQLGITEGAAKYHRHNVYMKLGVSSRQELINLVEEAACLQRDARG